MTGSLSPSPKTFQPHYWITTVCVFVCVRGEGAKMAGIDCSDQQENTSHSLLLPSRSLLLIAVAVVVKIIISCCNEHFILFFIRPVRGQECQSLLVSDHLSTEVHDAHVRIAGHSPPHGSRIHNYAIVDIDFADVVVGGAADIRFIIWTRRRRR